MLGLAIFTCYPCKVSNYLRAKGIPAQGKLLPQAKEIRFGSVVVKVDEESPLRVAVESPIRQHRTYRIGRTGFAVPPSERLH